MAAPYRGNGLALFEGKLIRRWDQGYKFALFGLDMVGEPGVLLGPCMRMFLPTLAPYP